MTEITTEETVEVSRKERFKGFLQLIRPLNALLFVFGVSLGAYLSGDATVFRQEWLSVLWTALSAMCIGCGANAINDYYDIEIDKINRPDRPIPAGILSENFVASTWGILSISGILLGFLVSWQHGVVALSSVILLFLYSARFKMQPFVGNFVVAAVVGSGILYGGMISELNAATYFAFGFAFLSNLIREMVKDIEDVDGDMWGNARTLPVILGTKKTLWLIIGTTLLLLLMGIIPYLSGHYSALFLLVLLVPYFFLLIGLFQLWNAPAPQAGAKLASQSLKWVMLTGMIALLIR
jgi:geranylgeranylglycerol-phosphate geranylgeranyltransferase